MQPNRVGIHIIVNELYCTHVSNERELLVLLLHIAHINQMFQLKVFIPTQQIYKGSIFCGNITGYQLVHISLVCYTIQHG